jgi:pimeloyl-ACP methyl ester carboxylesterase
MDGARTAVSLPDEPRWGHNVAPGSGGVRIHYVRHGNGVPVLLLHGWPGFWYDWRRVIPALAADADVIAPDFRGFGASDKPDLPPADAYTPAVFAADMLALLDHLDLDRVVVAGYDLGATIAQTLARAAPARVRALALFNPPYPGIGLRRFEPAAQAEAWYQHLHALPWSDRLIGHDRETVRLYLAHFYDHWMGRKEALHPEEFEAIVDTYAQPGAVRGSIAYYRARAGARLREATADPTPLRLAQQTVVLWGEADPVAPSAWADRLPEFFPNLTVRLLPGVGHFVPVEAPDDAIGAIRAALAATPS